MPKQPRKKNGQFKAVRTASSRGSRRKPNTTNSERRRAQKGGINKGLDGYARDASRKAGYPGKRRARSTGKTYYEYRVNRTDANRQPPKKGKKPRYI